MKKTTTSDSNFTTYEFSEEETNIFLSKLTEPVLQSENLTSEAIGYIEAAGIKHVLHHFAYDYEIEFFDPKYRNCEEFERRAEHVRIWAGDLLDTENLSHFHLNEFFNILMNRAPSTFFSRRNDGSHELINADNAIDFLQEISEKLDFLSTKYSNGNRTHIQSLLLSIFRTKMYRIPNEKHYPSELYDQYHYSGEAGSALWGTYHRCKTLIRLFRECDKSFEENLNFAVQYVMDKISEQHENIEDAKKDQLDFTLYIQEVLND